MKQLKTWNVVDYDHDVKHKWYFLADPAYDSLKIREKIRDLNLESLIPPRVRFAYQNKRNIKDPLKIRKLNECEKEIYKKSGGGVLT